MTNEDSPFPLELPEPDFEALAVAKCPDGLKDTFFQTYFPLGDGRGGDGKQDGNGGVADMQLDEAAYLYVALRERGDELGETSGVVVEEVVNFTDDACPFFYFDVLGLGCQIVQQLVLLY